VFQIWAIITLILKTMRKSKNISQPKRLVYSFVIEGKCELWYLQLLKQHENLNINFEPKLPKKKTLIEQFNLIKTLVPESEKVFWVIDFDAIMKETREAKRGEKTPLQKLKELCLRCKSNKKIIMIINNPCLEYWFLLHFERTSTSYDSYEQLKKPLQKHLRDYEKTEKYYKKSPLNIYQQLKPNLSIARTNAESLGEFSLDHVQAGIAEMYKIFKFLDL